MFRPLYYCLTKTTQNQNCTEGWILFLCTYSMYVCCGLTCQAAKHHTATHSHIHPRTHTHPHPLIPLCSGMVEGIEKKKVRFVGWDSLIGQKRKIITIMLTLKLTLTTEILLLFKNKGMHNVIAHHMQALSQVKPGQYLRHITFYLKCLILKDIQVSSLLNRVQDRGVLFLHRHF